MLQCCCARVFATSCMLIRAEWYAKSITQFSNGAFHPSANMEQARGSIGFRLACTFSFACHLCYSQSRSAAGSWVSSYENKRDNFTFPTQFYLPTLDNYYFDFNSNHSITSSRADIC